MTKELITMRDGTNIDMGIWVGRLLHMVVRAIVSLLEQQSEPRQVPDWAQTMFSHDDVEVTVKIGFTSKERERCQSE